MTDPARACARVPLCGADYLGRISGPLMDRFDLKVDVPPIRISELSLSPAGEESRQIAARVAAAREIQRQRFADFNGVSTNSDAEGELLNEVATPTPEGAAALTAIAEKFRLSARGYYRLLRVSRTIADLEGEETVQKKHIAEAASYRFSTVG